MYNANSYLLKMNAVIIAEKVGQPDQMWIVRKRTEKMVTLFMLSEGKLFGKPVTTKFYQVIDEIDGVERQVEFVKAARLKADTVYVDPKGFQPVTEQQKRAYEWTTPRDDLMPLSKYLEYLATLTPEQYKKEMELNDKGVNYSR